jgi:VanZ family protein
MIQKLFLPLVAAVCFILCFVGYPNTHKLRSLDILWNLGHIATYCLWTYLLVEHYGPLKRQAYGYQWIWVMGFALLFGALIEIIQREYLGRTADFEDIIKNMLGCGLSLAFFAPTRKNNGHLMRLPLQLMVLSALMGEFIPLAQAFTDEWIAKEQFPIIGTFEAPSEITRWKPSNSKITIDHHIKKQGKSSLRIDLTDSIYSGANLEFFPRDWRGFASISFSIYNPQKSQLYMVCRINDFDHNHHGYHYEDRFNKRIPVAPGWNHIEIPMEQIENAPVNRSMNMAEVDLFTVFFHKLDQPQSVYIDDLRLR